MPHPEHNNPSHIETRIEGDFIIIEWSNSDLDLNEIIAGKGKNINWSERRNAEKEKFVKAYIGEKAGGFTLWISTAKNIEHHLLYFSIPDQERKNIKAAGVIDESKNYFIISAPNLYDNMILDRDSSIAWMSNKLPNFI